MGFSRLWGLNRLCSDSWLLTPWRWWFLTHSWLWCWLWYCTLFGRCNLFFCLADRGLYCRFSLRRFTSLNNRGDLFRLWRCCWLYFHLRRRSIWSLSWLRLGIYWRAAREDKYRKNNRYEKCGDSPRSKELHAFNLSNKIYRLSNSNEKDWDGSLPFMTRLPKKRGITQAEADKSPFLRSRVPRSIRIQSMAWRTSTLLVQ